MSENHDQPRGNPEWGHWLNFWPTSPEIQHDFCGPHDIAGATCPNCDKALLRLISLNASDRRLNIDPARTPVVHLLYCWTCSIPFGEFSYRLGADGSVELLKVPPRYEYEFGPEGPYDGYSRNFPLQRVSLQPLEAAAQQALERRFADSSDGHGHHEPFDRHQIGGYPAIHNPQRMTCPACGADMPLLAMICDDATGNQPFKVSPLNSFSGNGGAQMVFHFCRGCAVVSAYHSCD